MDNTQPSTIIPPECLKTIACIREILVKEKESSQEISEKCKKNVRDTISKMTFQYVHDEDIRKSIQVALQNMFAQLGVNPEKEIYNY